MRRAGRSSRPRSVAARHAAKADAADLQHLLDRFTDEDRDFDVQALIRVAADVDTHQQRARLADALIRLRDRGLLTPREAAAAILDLDSSSKRVIECSVVEAIALAAGAVTTPGGLKLAA